MTTLKEIQSKEDSPSLSDAQKFVGGWVEVVQVMMGILYDSALPQMALTEEDRNIQLV